MYVANRAKINRARGVSVSHNSIDLDELGIETRPMEAANLRADTVKRDKKVSRRIHSHHKRVRDHA